MSTIGTKRVRMRIEYPVLTSDGQGGSATRWAVREVVWVRERPLTSRESLAAAQITAVQTSVIEMWWRSDVSVTDRLRDGTRILSIESVSDPTGQRAELHLVCSEAVEVL